MKIKILAFIAILSLLLLDDYVSNANTHTLTYSHSVDEGAIYTTADNSTVFVDANTLSELVAVPSDQLQVTYETNGYEIASIKNLNK